jgi:hypothetical protein
MAEPKDKKSVPGLRVTAKAEGFRRAGRTWPATPTELPLADFKKGEVEQLRAEPMLVIEDVEL